MKSRWILMLCGVLCIAAGLFPMLDALDFFPGSASRMSAPRWVVLTAGGLFFFAGLYVLLLSVVGEAKAKGFGAVVGISTFLGLSAIVNWIAFGGGDRSDCSGSISALGFERTRAAAEFECRAAFGYGALLLDFLFLRGAAWWIAKRAPDSRTARVLEKIFEWGFGLLLLPLILLAVVLTKGKDAVTGLARRLRSKGAQDKPPPVP